MSLGFNTSVQSFWKVLPRRMIALLGHTQAINDIKLIFSEFLRGQKDHRNLVHMEPKYAYEYQQ